MHYLLFYGHAKDLSLLELKSLYKGEIVSYKNYVAITTTPKHIGQLSRLLGGFIYISEVITDNPSSLSDTLADEINQRQEKNIAITNYSSLSLTRKDLFNLKKRVKRSIRYLSLDTSKYDLVPIKKQHALHLSITEEKGNIILSRSIWIHDFNQWNIRDRYKPYRSIKKGMMPPKLARIMLNLACEGKPLSLADPFCGTGTIAIESLLLGNYTYLSDIDKHSVEGAKSNIKWLISQYNLDNAKYEANVIDATHLSEKVSSIDAIVTEPFLGPLISEDEANLSRYSNDKLKNMIKGLEKLYKGALKDWHSILSCDKPSGGKVVMIIPEFRLGRENLTLNTIDTCENLGYNILVQAKYSKPTAHVIRNILVLRKSNGKNKTIR